MPMLKIVTIIKYLNITIIGLSWNYKTTINPKLSLTTFTHWFFQECQLIPEIVEGMSSNQEEPVQVYGFGAIAAND